MSDSVVDFTTVACCGAVLPIAFRHSTACVGLTMLGPASAVMFIAVHVPLALVRTWYDRERG